MKFIQKCLWAIVLGKGASLLRGQFDEYVLLFIVVMVLLIGVQPNKA